MELLKEVGLIAGKIVLSIAIPVAWLMAGTAFIPSTSFWFGGMVLAFIGLLVHGVYSIVAALGEFHVQQLDRKASGRKQFMAYRRELWKLKRKRKKLLADVLMSKPWHYSYRSSLSDLRKVEEQIQEHMGLTGK